MALLPPLPHSLTALPDPRGCVGREGWAPALGEAWGSRANLPASPSASLYPTLFTAPKEAPLSMGIFRLDRMMPTVWEEKGKEVEEVEEG